MCLNGPDKLVLRFDPIKTQIPILDDEVRGFAGDTRATQEDADAASAALEALYATLPAAQQAVLAQILLQASSAAG